eukprot:s1584_g22.t1
MAAKPRTWFDPKQCADCRRGWLRFYRSPPSGLEDIIAARPESPAASLWDGRDAVGDGANVPNGPNGSWRQSELGRSQHFPMTGWPSHDGNSSESSRADPWGSHNPRASTEVDKDHPLCDQEFQEISVAYAAWDDPAIWKAAKKCHEPEILSQTLTSLAQAAGAHSFHVVLAMEAREGDPAVEKAKMLSQNFGKHFASLTSTWHPANLRQVHMDGSWDPEIPGKASNLKQAVNDVYRDLMKDGKDASSLLLTVADADVLFHPRYFSYVANDYVQLRAQGGDRHEWTLWQAPQLPFRNYFASPACSRVWAYVASLYEFGGVAGLSLGSDHFVFSTYSLPLRLAVEAEAHEGDVIAEDHHCYIRCFFYSVMKEAMRRSGQTSDLSAGFGAKTQLRPVFLPVKATSVVSETALQTWKDRWLQAKRHAQGVAEVSCIVLSAADALRQLPFHLWTWQLTISVARMAGRLMYIHMLPSCQFIATIFLALNFVCNGFQIQLCGSDTRSPLLCGLAGAWNPAWPAIPITVFIVACSISMVFVVYLQPLERGHFHTPVVAADISHWHFALAINVALAQQDWRTGLRWLEKLEVDLVSYNTEKSLEADIISYNSLFRYCHWQRAKELLELQSRRSLEATTISYNSVMAGCPWLQALALQEQIFSRSLRVSVVTYGSAISLSHWPHVFCLLRDMRQLLQESNVMVHAAAIDACEKAERWQPSLALLEDAVATSLANLVTYTASLSACVKGTRWEAAGYLYNTLEDCSLQGNLVTHTAAINACAKGWSWEEAIQLLGTCGQDALAVSAAMDAGVKAMQWSQVLWILRSFQQTDASGSLELCDAAIDVCVRSSQWARAVSLFSEISAVSALKPSLLSCTAAMNACEKTDPSSIWTSEAGGLPRTCGSSFWTLSDPNGLPDFICQRALPDLNRKVQIAVSVRCVVPKRAGTARGLVDGAVSMEPAPSSPRVYSNILTDMSPLKKRR